MLLAICGCYEGEGDGKRPDSNRLAREGNGF